MNDVIVLKLTDCFIDKIHRYYVPKFMGTLPQLVPVRRFAAALKRHD